MRIVIDYRPALRARTGVGEYIHHVAGALARAGTDDITLFSSSWKDRPSAGLASELPRVTIVDRRIPVSVLNLAWHRLEWPPVEAIARGDYDVAHSPHPLLLPSRSAASVVTIHDLHFLSHPERSSQEIRRDYPALAGAHARRADRIVVSSRFAAGEVQRLLNVPSEHIAICPAGAPEWKTEPARVDGSGYILFMGTLDARKNIDGLLEAYGRLLSRIQAPRLVIAGGAGPDAAKWLEAIARPPLAGHVEYLGYVSAERREATFKEAQMFVLPSFEEGFGLPALEAMSAGVPVVASNRGSLPEVVSDAGLLIDPDDPESLTDAMARIATDARLRGALAERGLVRARQFNWAQTARDVHRAYEDALLARRARDPKPKAQSPTSSVESPASGVKSSHAHRD
ncbi:MAG TPA: glycosyltransferase family 1 protein [Vicinamibacterales bacterium]|nr:glycosyltransferase family 1 protein [Vicinamibacterales bacterium]